MDNLVVIQNKIGNSAVDCIDARELHRLLEVKDTFSRWILRRIEEARLLEAIDYGFLVIDDLKSVDAQSQDTSPGRPEKNYMLTIDAAEIISMLERTDKGHEIRLWIVDRKHKTQDAIRLLKTKLEKELKIKDTRINELTKQLAETSEQKLLVDQKHQKEKEYTNVLERNYYSALDPKRLKKSNDIMCNTILVDDSGYSREVVGIFDKIIKFYNKNIKRFYSKDIKYCDKPAFEDDNIIESYGATSKREKRIYILTEIWEKELGGTDEMVDYLVKKNLVELTRARTPYTLIELNGEIHEALAIKNI